MAPAKTRAATCRAATSAAATVSLAHVWQLTTTPARTWTSVPGTTGAAPIRASTHSAASSASARPASCSGTTIRRAKVMHEDILLFVRQTAANAALTLSAMHG
jgi:hypothetical protein